MRRSTVAVAGISVFALGLLTGGTASAASPNDSACRSGLNLADGVNSAEVLAYQACRFDKLDASVSSLGVPTPVPSDSPSPTPSASPSPSVFDSPTPTPAVTLTPTPTPSTMPTLTPSPTPTAAAGFPTAASTGVPDGTSLASSGGLTITTAGAVVDGKDISGAVVVRAKDVTIRNSRIKGTGGAYCVQTQNGGTVTLEDVEIVGGCENGIGFDGWTAKRTEIRGTYGDGVKLGSNVLLQDSWIHDLAPANGAHADGGQVQGGIVNTVVRHNTIDLSTTPNANAALFLAPDQGPNSNGPLTVDSNKLNGGNFTVFCVDGNNGQYLIKNIAFTGNRFGDKFSYGRSNVNVPITQSGNVVDRTGAAYSL